MTPSVTRSTQDGVLVVADIVLAFRASKPRKQGPSPWARIFSYIATNSQLLWNLKELVPLDG